jgi:hypothetical protein
MYTQSASAVVFSISVFPVQSTHHGDNNVQLSANGQMLGEPHPCPLTHECVIHIRTESRGYRTRASRIERSALLDWMDQVRWSVGRRNCCICCHELADGSACVNTFILFGQREESRKGRMTLTTTAVHETLLRRRDGVWVSAGKVRLLHTAVADPVWRRSGVLRHLQRPFDLVYLVFFWSFLILFVLLSFFPAPMRRYLRLRRSAVTANA